MTTPDGYIRELESLTKSIKTLTLKTKELRERKTRVSDRLYTYLCTHKLDEYKGYKTSKLAPKIKVKRKSKKEKEKDALILFEEIGVANPRQFWEDFQRTQIYNISQSNEDEDE